MVKKSKERRVKNYGRKKGVKMRHEEEVRRAPKLGVERTIESLGVWRGKRDLIFKKGKVKKKT